MKMADLEEALQGAVTRASRFGLVYINDQLVGDIVGFTDSPEFNALISAFKSAEKVSAMHWEKTRAWNLYEVEIVSLCAGLCAVED